MAKITGVTVLAAVAVFHALFLVGQEIMIRRAVRKSMKDFVNSPAFAERLKKYRESRMKAEGANA